MTPAEWQNICDSVAAAMTCHTRPFVTPLSTSDEEQVRLVGSGSYVTFRASRILITCEHVARTTPMESRFYGSETVFRHPAPFTTEPQAIDAAFALITDVAWKKVEHHAASVPYERFAHKHHVADRNELIFFRGYAGENAHYSFGTHQANGTGYCSQEKVLSEPDPQIFEIFWEPDKTEFTHGTSAETRANIKCDDPRGFSGSLVWNTRFREKTTSGDAWTPNDSVITGLLHRFDPNTKTLLVLRVEHLRTWIEEHLSP
jgi:hypothetical protein